MLPREVVGMRYGVLLPGHQPKYYTYNYMVKLSCIVDAHNSEQKKTNREPIFDKMQMTSSKDAECNPETYVASFGQRASAKVAFSTQDLCHRLMEMCVLHIDLTNSIMDTNRNI